MSILGILLSFIFAVNCSYYQGDYDLVASYTATGAEIPNGLGGGPNAKCVVTFSYTAATTTISGTLSCTGLSSAITQAHIHTTGDKEVCGNSAGVLVTLSAAGETTFTNLALTSLDSVCEGYTYINVHTTNFPNGEVRANLVDMFPTCATGQNSTQRAIAMATIFPDQLANSGVPGFVNSITCGTTPSCTVQLSYDSQYDELYINGVCSGITGNVTTIIATNQDTTGSTTQTFLDTGGNTGYNACPPGNRYGGYVQLTSGDIDTLCTPTTSKPWTLDFATDANENVQCTFPVGFCPGVLTSPVGAPGSTPNPPPPKSSGYTFSVTILFTLFLLISLWLN